jgi:arylsulfatase A-like enzyme
VVSQDEADKTRGWKIQIILIVFIVYLYILMEWLFYVTKPSFLYKLGLFDKIQVLLVTPIPLVVVGCVVLFLCLIPLIVKGNRIIQRVCSTTVLIITALILGAVFFLLVDNFAYTVLRFGVRNTTGAAKLSYWFLLLVLVVFAYYVLLDLKKMISRTASYRAAGMAALAMIFVSIVIAVVTFDASRLGNFTWSEKALPLEDTPNIILLSSDGLNAEHMSVYGYHRETTPYLDELANDALLCENCFVNADASGGSIASMFTGKLPTQTRLLYPPEILGGKDAYQHLPGILRKHGYRNADISVRHHADPLDINMRNSFHWANDREIEQSNLSVLSSALLGDKSVYFIGKMRERITIRLLHLLNVRRMKDPLGEVGRPRQKYNKDSERVKDMFAFIDRSPPPFFVHVHLLGTHGPKFRLSNRVFSAGKKETGPWMTDFYDDAILCFDGLVKEMMQGLRKRRISHNTVVIICTDHGQRWAIDVRTPLIFIFPYGENSGRITMNVQNLDIAPTILDCLGIEQPEWMGGISLLSSTVDSQRFIFTATRKRGTIRRTQRGRELDEHKTGPPFYSVGSVGVFFRQRLYELKLAESVLAVSDIEGHTSPCSEENLPDPQEVGRMIIDHLAGNNFDTSSIKIPLTVNVME